MKMRRIRKTLSIIFILIFVMISAGIAQVDDSNKNPDGTYSSKKYSEAEKPDDSYLAKFYAIDVVNNLLKKNLEQVYLIKVLVSNFKGKGWEEDYNKIYDGYK